MPPRNLHHSSCLSVPSSNARFTSLDRFKQQPNQASPAIEYIYSQISPAVQSSITMSSSAPPVAAGAAVHQDSSTYPHKIHLPDENIYLELTYSPLDTTSILSQVSSPSAGANILFLGTTRDSFNNRAVSQLSYTSYAPLALKTLTEIARETKRAFAAEVNTENGPRNTGLIAISISHRLGVVPISEASIAIAVSAGHRGPAWRAGETLLESCKERLEVWKREEFVGERPEDGEWRANRDTDKEGKIISK